MAISVSPKIVKHELDGLQDMYNDCLGDSELLKANVHVQLAFTIANIRSDYANTTPKPKHSCW